MLGAQSNLGGFVVSFTFIVACGVLLLTPPTAASADREAAEEEAKARASESEAVPSGLLVGFPPPADDREPASVPPSPAPPSIGAVYGGPPAVVPPSAAPLGVVSPLFVGLDDATVPAYLVDPDTSNAVEAFTGVQVWGAAYDPLEGRVYVSEGIDLYEWFPGGGPPALLGTIVDSTATTVAMEGLAFFDGTLYASKAGSTGEGEGIYEVDPSALTATRVIAFPDPAQTTISGLDADPATGQLYGTNDATALRGLVSIDPDGTVTVVANYAAGETDVDGLAVGGGRAYLITDDQTPPEWDVWDFAAGAYVDTVTSPFTTSEVFAGGAWIEGAAFDTLGFGWNSQNGRYYTVFHDPRTLPVTAPFDGTGAFIGAGELVDGSIYMIDAGLNMWEVHPGTGQILDAFTATAPPSGESYSGLAVDPTTGVVYACSTNITTSTLFTIDVATGTATTIGTVTNAPGLIAIAIDGAGELWGYDINTDMLLSINKTTAAGAVVGPIGFDASFGQGLAWDVQTDTLYMAAFNNGSFQAELRTVNRTTGATTLVQVLGADLPGGLNQLGWLALADEEYLQVFSDGFESGDTSGWSNTVP